MLPSHRLLARAFHRTPAVLSSPSSLSSTSSTAAYTRTHQRLISTSPTGKWEGRHAKDHAVRETDSHNVQQDAVREGKAERAKSVGEGSASGSPEGGVSRGVSEKAGESNRKAKEEFPEAPDTIGMQDERGQKS